MRLRLPERLSLVDVILWGLRVGVVVFVVTGSFATLSQGLLGFDSWRSLVIVGLAQGAIYALIALGYTLVYGVLFMINFAHGEVFMAGTYTAFFVAAALADADLLNSALWISIPAVLGTAMLTSMAVAIVLERIAYRPLRNAPRLVPLITAIGASLFLQNTFRGFYGAGFSAYPPLDILRGSLNIGGFVIGRAQLVVIVAAIVLMLALWYLVQYTRVGRAMRAVSEDKDVAAMMGINVDRVIVITFAIGGLLAGAAGVLYVQIFNQVSFAMGILPGIKAFTAAVIGGIGNIIGAMLGGLLLGILEALAPYLLLEGFNIPSINQLKDVVAFSALVLVLIFRPEGLLGRKENI
jgi:branched-chain amino acid transport system permease protein